MPWVVADVEKHRKGLSKNQKQKWVKAANDALKTCIAEGVKKCDGRAIRIANSIFEKGSRRKT